MKIHELIGTIDNWTTGHSAINAGGRAWDPRSPSAVRWDIEGAALKCYEDTHNILPKIRNGIFKRTGKAHSIAVFNDLAKHSEIIKLLKELDV